MKYRNACLGLAPVLIAVLLAAGAAFAAPGPTSENNSRLKQALELYPEADANKDGVLTMEEARAYLRTRRGDAQGNDRDRGERATSGDAGPPITEEMRKADAELAEKLAAAGSESIGKDPLSFPKGNGLRVVSTGHSWVGPAMRTFPEIAAAAGLGGHRHRRHLGGGGSGSANSIWRKELGKYKDGSAPRPILLSAIATGQWDVMTWGLYHRDRPEYFEQWIDFCLRHNPDMVFYLQDAWTGTMGSRSENQLSLEKFLAAQRPINDHVQRLAEALNEKYPGKVRVIPVGNAMLEMLKLYYAEDLPGIEGLSQHLGGKEHSLWRDGGHLGKLMSWWEGYCYYAAIYKKSPESIDAPFEVTRYNKQLDQRMRQCAWRAVVNHPLSGVRDKDGNGIGDETEKR